MILFVWWPGDMSGVSVVLGCLESPDKAGIRVSYCHAELTPFSV